MTRQLGRPVGARDRHGRCNRVRWSRSSWASARVAFGHHLSDVLEERDVAATELAAAIGVHWQTVMAWRRGRIPGFAALAAIAEALSCSIIDLLPEQAHSPGGVP